MQKFIATLFLLLILQTLQAQEAILSLWPANAIPNSKNTSATEKRDSTDILRISRVQSPDLAVFLPSAKTATGQAVIICPGGGYTYLSYNWEGTDVAKLLNARGIAAFVLKYRLPDPFLQYHPHQVPLMDVQRAMRMVRYYAPRWKINKSQIGIMGFSAGGHLASTLGTHFDSGNLRSIDSIEQQTARPDFMVLVYPVISMSKNIMHAGSRNKLIGEKPEPNLAQFYSNEMQVKKNSPPAFLVHASDDKAVPVENSLYFYQALKDQGISVEMHVFPKGGHGFGLGLGRGGAEKWSALCLDWMASLQK
jgi:acetyl esterase/lipase